MRILIRTSKWAIWSRRFGALALPMALIPVILHREHFITSDNFLVIEAIAIGLAALAIVMAAIAFGRLWFTGDQGWRKATLGLIFGLICVAPASYLLAEALRYPNAPDVSTDFTNPPTLVSFVPGRFIGPDERERIDTAFPNARSRTYPLEAPQMFEIVASLLEDRDWDSRSRRAPQSALGAGQINAVATTLLGWRQEIAVRVVGTADGSTVAMRSASLSSAPDFGENGRRIEAFMLDLDNAVTTVLRDAPTASSR